jgi:hypothetical protein
LNSDRVYAGATGLTQLTLPSNAPIFSEISIANNSGSTGFEIIPPPGIRIVHQGVSQQDKLITSQNPATIKLLCTSAPNEWTVVEFSGVFAFINTLTMNIGIDLTTLVPTSTIEIVSNYTITAVAGTYQNWAMHAPGVYFSLEYWRLNDSSFTTGVGATNYLSPAIETNLTFDLGGVMQIHSVQVSGGFLAFPFNDNTSSYINGCPLQWSNDNQNWTTITTVSGVLDNNTYITIPIGLTVRYLRLVNNGGGTIATTSFVVYRTVTN